MDMETLTPRTCQICKGTGVEVYYIDEDTFDTCTCECKMKEKNNG